MKLFNWTKPRTASVEELREQLEHATKAHEDALATACSSQEAFDDTGTDSAAKALTSARDVVRHAEEHLGRARRLLEAAEAERAAAERAELQRQHDAIVAELSAPDEVGTDLERREGEAYHAAFEARDARHQHTASRNARRREQEALGQALGHSALGVRAFDNMPHGIRVAEVIRRRLVELSEGGVRNLAISVANLLDPSRTHFLR